MPHLGEFTKKTHAGLSAAADLHSPKAHKTSHQDGGSDEITVLGLAGQQIFVPYNGKIADITETDTNKHTLNLATALSETRTIIDIRVLAKRISGSGSIRFYPNEGTDYTNFYDIGSRIQAYVTIASGTNRLQYDLTVAKDDWDLYCLGYVVVSA